MRRKADLWLTAPTDSSQRKPRKKEIPQEGRAIRRLEEQAQSKHSLGKGMTKVMVS